MPTPRGIVRVHQAGSTLAIQVEGWGTMLQSLPLRRCVEKAVGQGVTHVCFDLSACQYIDSTFLGTLFMLKRRVRDLRLLSLSQPCWKLFQQMGVENCFPFSASEEPAITEWRELEGVGEETQAMHRNVIQAHQELAGMEGKVGDTFRPVAQCLARELDATDLRAPSVSEGPPPPRKP